MNHDDLVQAMDANLFRVTDHADEEMAADGLTLDQVLHATRCGEIIEKYVDDKPYPSCLIYGRTPDDAPVHAVWAYNVNNGWAVLITVYRPDPQRWIESRQRRPK
jgi:hypothetical protein